MRTHEAGFSLILGLCCACFAAEQTPPAITTLTIKNMVSNTDFHLKNLNKSSAVLQTGTDRGGKLIIYRKGSDVIRVDAIVEGSNSGLHDVFYYSGENLVFVRTKTVIYPFSSTSGGFDFANPHVKARGDYYVREGKLIPIRHAETTPSLASRLLQESTIVIRAIRDGKQTVDIERLLR